MLKREREDDEEATSSRTIKKEDKASLYKQLCQKLEEHNELVSHSTKMIAKRHALELENGTAKGSSSFLHVNVGGEPFAIPIRLLQQMEEQNTYLHRLLWDVAPKLYCEDGKSLFIDRDPDSFRHVLNYLRGYKENYFRLLAEDTIKKLKSDADFYQLRGLGAIFSDEKKSKFLFNPGPGVSADRIRQCIVYSVFTVGDVFLVTGKHSITYRIHNVEYLGVGLVSDSCVDMDREHHKVPNSCVYYMSGVFYSNYTFHRKEENLETLQPNDIVTLTVDMDKKVAEFQLKNTRKVVSLGKCSGVKFSVTMKYSSKIEIVNQT